MTNKQLEQVEIVTLEEKHFVGVAVTNAFKRVNPKSIREVNDLFLSRIKEIPNVINADCYVCPHFANDFLFTYIYSMEVSRYDEVPEGMIGFSVPRQSYAKVRSTEQDPYALIKAALEAMNRKNNTRSLALEVFRFGEEQHVRNADVFVPIL
ncbi:effector binding domain-containing protein [Paenibacillus sp. BK033]|uniref:GyrI-like domain-containing protein n=1 Tax=unclassified Paenibacillus TaxID=185978 RepID=UPI0010D61F7B|nr:effector binding domain-containing protein [Paenibacillus sp. BK033]NIK68721.1 putative transcriptional regulator YdeE [Paenibacillus sp. BK720]TCM98994.1 integron-associated effector binding protein [Paenibacillus sp. BK033]